MALATSTDHGHNLQTVQLLIKKNQVHKHRHTPSLHTWTLLTSCTLNFFSLWPLTLTDPAEGDSGSSAAIRRHLRAQPARPAGGQPDGRGHSPAARRAPVAVGTDQEGDGEASRPAQRGPRGPAVLLRRRRGRGLDERTGALHDVRGEGQGEVTGRCVQVSVRVSTEPGSLF